LEISARLKWIEDLKFSADLPDGRVIQLDSGEQMGDAFTPMELFLVALAGCTAMDVSWIMAKQKQKVESLEVAISGKRRREDPRYYETIHIEYRISGSDIRRAAVERAIRLSREKYCSVRAMLKDSIKVNTTYTVTEHKRLGPITAA